LHDPCEVAVVTDFLASRIYVLDAGARKIAVADANGNLSGSFDLSDPNGPLTQPLGLAVGTDAFYVGDNGRRRIFKFELNGDFVGESLRYEGPIASLAITDNSTLLVHTGGNIEPLSLALRGGHVKHGLLWSKMPFANPSTRVEQWHRVKCLCDPLTENTHLQLHHTSIFPAPPPNPNSVDAFNSPPWISVPPDASDALLEGKAGEDISVGVSFAGDGFASPVLRNIRIDFGYETHLQNLPAIYQEEETSRKFLTRFLSLFESSFEDAETEICALGGMFDPAAARSDVLPWLAGWVGLEVPEIWEDPKKREAIAEAFASYASRGTAEGLRKTLKVFAGVEVHIEEPIQNAHLWSLPDPETEVPANSEGSILGYTTMLAPAPPYGAALGSTAVVDQSYLTGGDDLGEALFCDVAHRFNVLVYQGGGYSERSLAETEAIIEREKPAHTSSHVCVVEPQFKIGFQARLGVDAIVSGDAGPSRLQDGGVAGSGLVLGGGEPGRIGVRSRIGQTTRLDESGIRP
jgi:phage tail-like protein